MKESYEHALSFKKGGGGSNRASTFTTDPECTGLGEGLPVSQFQRIGPLPSRATWAGLQQAEGISVGVMPCPIGSGGQSMEPKRLLSSLKI